MRTDLPEKYRIGPGTIVFHRKIPDHLRTTADIGANGLFYIPRVGKSMSLFFWVIVSDGTVMQENRWEHISISIPSERRCPTWEEMCYLKSLFWRPDEAVMQLHPPESEYVNNHPYCLHLWRPVDAIIPLPPHILVGSKSANINGGRG